MLLLRSVPTLAVLLLLAFGARAQWSANPAQNTVVRDSATHDEPRPMMAPGPDGSTYFAWFEEVPRPLNYQLRMQRLDSAGRPMWAPRGLVVSAQPQAGVLFRYDLKADHNGDAILVFQDVRNGNNLAHPVAYKITAAGQLAWGNGIDLTDPLSTSGLAPTICITNANNVVVAWNCNLSQSDWVSARKLSPTGALLWTDIKRWRDPADQFRYTRPEMLPVGADDVLILCAQQSGSFPPTSTPFIERLDPTGAARWQAIVSVRTLPYDYFAVLRPDGADGAYCVFNTSNPANGSYTSVFAQHLRANGTVAWGPNGVELVTGNTTQRFLGDQDTLSNHRLAVLLTETDPAQDQAGLTLQVIDSTGNRVLGPGGHVLRPVQVPRQYGIGLRARPNDKLVLLLMEDSTRTTARIRAVGITAAGAVRWGASAVASVVSNKNSFNLSEWRGEQLVLGWGDGRLGGGGGVYAQTVDTLGRLGGNVPVPVIPLATPRLATAGVRLLVWPNPGGHSALRLAAPAPTAAVLTLTDVLGRPVWRRPATLAAGTSDLPLPAELVPGYYHVTLTAPGWQAAATWVKE